MTTHFLTLSFVAAVLTACGDSASPSDAANTATTFDLRPSQAINIVAGDSIRLDLNVLDASGQRVVLRNPGLSWRVTPPIATVRADGLLQPHTSGDAWVAIDVDGTARDSVRLRVLSPSGTFRIRFLYAADIPQKWRDALESGARRWEDTVAGELLAVPLVTPADGCGSIPDEAPVPLLSGEERGVTIYVVQSRHFPPGTYTEAVAGPCLQRPLPFPTTIFGSVTLNRDKPVDAIPAFRLRHLAVHELGHVLGLVGVVQGEQPSWYDVRSGRYTGAMALEGWRRKFGVIPDAIFSRAGAHWDPMPVADVMISSGLSGEISLISIGALMDLGYPVRWSGAGPF